ncbi:exosome-associated family protein [Histoplasma capsulatum var. duboisii H88]|uniref:Exosome complex protein n=1 Tax=Ajellomyces capsulatus (strain H88) TaxID=544711 RepID=F0UPV5_AJEC8|nr:exosome-associated family protein [Histoplasma capsulatum var. duboisii H88]QSS54002.1 exosome-associated family protein [Histoplasma capsulatum var. duboisii H88]
METTDLTPLIEQLEDNIDDLEDVLEPLLGQPLSATTQKMPVMDKAKLHVLITYAIESLIFSYLRLQGVNAKEHPVFKELTRVKQYFEKIKTVETVPEKRTTAVDKEAAGRFIKHGLAGNDKYDLERAERDAKEKAMALLKAAKLARQQASKSQPQPKTQSITHKEQQAPTEVDSELGNTGSKGGQHLKVMPSLGRSPKGKKDKGKKKVQAQKPQAQKAQTQKAQARKEQRQARRKHKQAVRKANNQSNP